MLGDGVCFLRVQSGARDWTKLNAAEGKTMANRAEMAHDVIFEEYDPPTFGPTSLAHGCRSKGWALLGHGDAARCKKLTSYVFTTG